MLWRSMENIGCKCLILNTWGCSVSQLNGGGCSLWGGRKHHIYSPESTVSIRKKTKEDEEEEEEEEEEA